MAKNTVLKCPSCGTELDQQHKGCPKCRLQNPFYGTNRENAEAYALELQGVKKRSRLITFLTLLSLILFALLLNLTMSIRTAKQLTSSLSSDEVRDSRTVAEENYETYGMTLETYLQEGSYVEVAAFAVENDLLDSEVYRPYRLVFEQSLSYTSVFENFRDAALGDELDIEAVINGVNDFYRYYDPENYTDENGQVIEVAEDRTLKARINMDRDIRYMIASAFDAEVPSEDEFPFMTEEDRAEYIRSLRQAQ